MNYITTDTELISIASAIRAKGSTAASLVYPTGFVDAIASISVGIDTSDATAASNDILLGTTAYASNIKLVGTLDLSTATASASDILLGMTAYTSSGKITGTIASKSAEIYEIATTDRVIAAGQYLAGPQTIKGAGENIRQEITDPVRFFDYDGTLLYSYSTSDFLALTEMPANPSHTDMGLEAQGWNWSLNDAKEQVNHTNYCDIGQLYTTISGKTELDIELAGPSRLCLSGTYETDTGSANIIIDWGDGSGQTYLYSNGTYHSYQAGNYTIKIWPQPEGKKWYFKPNNTWSGCGAFSGGGQYYGWERAIRNSLKAIRFGSGCTGFDGNSFSYCDNIRYMTFSNEITRMDFTGCSTNYYPLTIICPSNEIYPKVSCTKGLRILSKNIPYYEFIHGEGRLVCPYGMDRINITRGFSEIILPSSIYSFYDNCFQGNPIKNIKITSPQVLFYPSPFKYCTKLESIDLPANFSFYYNDSSQFFAYCSSLNLTTFPMPSTCPSIGIYMFQGNLGLEKFTIPSNVTYIGQNAFQHCENLMEITIPDSVTTISNYALSFCSSLTSLTIPSSVTKIGNYAFAYSSSLREVHFKGTNPPALQSRTFYGLRDTSLGGGKIYVPTGTLADYQSAPSYPSTGFTYYEE